MANEVKVYGKPGCYGCRATTRQLDKIGVPHTYVDITVNEAAYQEVKNMGFSGMPVVAPASGKPWSGYSPDKINALKP